MAEALANNIVIADASAAEKADEESNDESNSNEDNTGNEEGEMVEAAKKIRVLPLVLV